MDIFHYFIRDKVENPEGHEFYVKTMNTCRYFFPFWDVLGYKIKHPPEGITKPLFRIKPFYSFVFHACDESNPIICIENGNKGNATRAHENLCKMLEKGHFMGP